MAYNNNSIVVIRDDIDRIRKRPEAYIGYRHWMAFIHLIKEVLQNIIDESAVDDSELDIGEHRCDQGLIDFDERTKEITLIDNGRGIPLDMIYDICTVLQSSGKYDKGKGSAYRKASGENGMGLTCVCALSKKFVVSSTREGKKKTLTFECGRLISEIIEDVKTKKTGTSITFIPDEQILLSIKTDYKQLLGLCETMSYLSKIALTVHVTTKSSKDINEVYIAKNGIVDMVGTLTVDPICKPIYIEYDGEDMGMECAFLYDPENKLAGENGGNLILSYANFCTTIQGGTHVEGFKAGLSSFMIKYIKDNCMNKKELNDLNILGDDVRSDLVAVVNVYLEKASFVGQVKEKLSTPEMNAFVKTAVVNGLNKWANENGTVAKKLGDYIKSMAKIRINNSKQKKQVVSKNFDSIFSLDRPPAWSGPCTVLEDIMREIMIVEGDSASGTVKQAMNRLFQEIYKMRGVPKNTVGRPFSEVWDNVELKGLTTVLTNGKGPKIKAEECPYDKIIIKSDADVDGHRITSLLSGYFLYHMPQLVEAGKVYKLLPPLYKVTKGNKDIYFNDNRSYAKYVQKEIVANMTIYIPQGKINYKCTDDDIIELMLNTKDYYRELKKRSRNAVMDTLLFEFILTNLHYLKMENSGSFQKLLKIKVSS